MAVNTKGAVLCCQAEDRAVRVVRKPDPDAAHDRRERDGRFGHVPVVGDLRKGFGAVRRVTIGTPAGRGAVLSL